MATKKKAKKKPVRRRKLPKVGPFYTRGEAAQILGLTVSGVRGLEARGVLEGQRAGVRWVFSPADIQRAKVHTRAGKQEQKRRKLEALQSADEVSGAPLEAPEERPPAARAPTLDPMVANAFSMLEARKRPMDLILELNFTPERTREIVEQYRDILSLSSATGNSELCVRCKSQPACVCLECAGAPSSRPSSSSRASSKAVGGQDEGAAPPAPGAGASPKP